MPPDARLPSSHRPTSWYVWLVTDVFPPNCGGSGWSTHALARVLGDHGHRVEVIVVSQSQHDVTVREYDGIPVTEVGVRHSRTLRRRLGARDYAHDYVARYLDARLRESPDVDIVHAQHLHSGPPAIEAGRAQGRATLATVRDYWPVCLHGTSWWGGANCDGCTPGRLTSCMTEYWGWPAPISRAMVGWAHRRLEARGAGLASADKVLVVSEAVRQRIAGSVRSDSLSVVPNIVDPAAVQSAAANATPEREGPYLLTAGKLQPTKGFDLLLRVLADIKPELPLLVAGDGPSRSALEHQARTSGVDATFLGWVDHDRLLGLQRDAQAVILPSAWHEPLSRLVLETMGLGTPVIAWALGGTPEIIESGVSGWLVSSPSDLVAALRELRSPQRRLDVATASVRRAEQHYSPAVVYPLVAAAYAAALEKSTCRSRTA